MHLIVNPAAAGGRLGREWPQMAKRLRELGLDAPASMTKAPGHAADLAAEAIAGGADVVVGCHLEQMVEPLREFKGLLRRFSVSRTPKGITVIDDYAHNPDKIRAAILTARDFGARLFAVFQPHGYGPTRFLKDELVETFARIIRDTDELFFLPIYYAGGTVKKDISSEDLADWVKGRGVMSYVPHSRKELLTDLKQRVKPGDAVILMGARDPTLSLLAQEIKDSL